MAHGRSFVWILVWSALGCGCSSGHTSFTPGTSGAGGSGLFPFRDGGLAIGQPDGAGGATGGRGAIGDKCAASNSCPSGGYCAADVPGGGYCTADCGGTGRCPAGSGCVAASDVAKVCLKTCAPPLGACR